VSRQVVVAIVYERAFVVVLVGWTARQDAQRMHPAFDRIDHRPWPLPRRPWIGRQAWCDLAFLHWPVPAERLRALVPEPLAVQTFEGTAWLGIVPFRIEDFMLRGLPALPGFSAFPELNVRTYVEHAGKPGVWFFSLDAQNAAVVWGGGRLVHLPYRHAAIDVTEDRRGFDYRLTRADAGERFTGRYAPASDVFEARPGTLDHFLCERYCLYARSPHGAFTRIDVHHVPWPLQRAAVEVTTNTMTAALGLELIGQPPVAHFASRVDVATWAPERAG
jgi:hypothetical protein